MTDGRDQDQGMASENVDEINSRFFSYSIVKTKPMWCLTNRSTAGNVDFSFRTDATAVSTSECTHRLLAQLEKRHTYYNNPEKKIKGYGEQSTLNEFRMMNKNSEYFFNYDIFFRESTVS